MNFVKHLQCVACGAEYEPSEVKYTCPACGPDEGILDVQFDLLAAGGRLTATALAEAPLNHWRYGPLLPVNRLHAGRAWPIGWTPVIETPALAREVGVRRLRLKDDGRNASGSFKDRASSVGVVRAIESGYAAVTCASTGNAAASLAACAAMAHLPAFIFVSRSIPDGKLAQLLIYGATVFKIDGSYDDAYRLSMQAAEEFGWYNRCAAYNPYLVEGKKTGGLELAEQCREDRPDWVAVSVGDGCTVAGIEKGLREMRVLGLIDWSARILAVQPEHVAPIAAAFESGRLTPCQGDTFADSINVPVPRNWRKAVNAVRATDGRFVTVSDESIRKAMRVTGATTGIFAEPAAAAAVAGIAEAVQVGIIDASANVAAFITGTGLKDLRGGMSAVASGPIEIPPVLDRVKTYVASTAQVRAAT